MTPSSSRSAPAISLDEPATKQRESLQLPAAAFLNASMSTESSSLPAMVPYIPSAVPLMNPDSSQAVNTNVEYNH